MTIFQKKISMCSFFRIDIIITFIIAVLGICSGSAQQTNISLYYSTEGKVDYSIIGNSELTETGGTNNCGTDTATVSNLSLPAGSIILKAYVHWYALTYNPAKFSGYSALGNFKFKTPDGTNYTLDGTAYQGSTTFLSGTTYEGKKADVTSIIKGLSNANGSYTGDVTGGARFNLCPLSQENARAWTLTIVYADCSLTNNNKVYLYDGLFGLYSNAATIPITGYNVPTSGSTAGTMTSVTLQGDPNLSGEILSTSDAIFPNYPSDFANSSNGGALDIDALSGNFTAGTTSMNLDATTTGDVIIFGEFALKVSSVPVSPPLITAMENSCTPNDDKVQFGTAVNLVASGGVGYAWNNGLGSGSIKSVTPLFPTTYTVTVTDANGCTLTATKNISILVPPIASIAATETSCTANDNKILTGSSVGLTASAFGGGGGYTFTWNNSLGTGTTKSAAPSTTTPYTVTVSDANGCVSTANKIIEVVSAPLISINSTEGSCTPNDNNVLSGASVSLTITGGTSYSWSTGETTASITKTPSATTTYTVTATDANGCTNTASRTITVITTPTASITATESSCIANDDKILSGGSANLMGSASGGGGSFTYNWSNSLGTGVGPKSVSPTSTTIYTVTATDANGCTATASKTITIATNVTASIASTENSCIANDDKVLSGGTVNLTASGGATYTWSNSLGAGASKTATPSVTTTYSVTATDADGCTATASKTITVVSAPAASIAATESSCAANDDKVLGGASVSLTASGGTSYTWDNSLGTGANKIITPSVSTTYSVTSTDANGCTATATKTITAVTAPTTNISATESSCTSNDDKITNGSPVTLTASGGTGYTWSNSLGTGATKTPSPSVTTTYSVTATDANGCTATASKLITVSAALSLSNTATNILCNGGSTGAIDLTVSGGTSPYTYNWNDSNTAQDRTGLAAGAYSVTVTDASGCSQNTSITLTQPTAMSLITTPTNILCSGASTGAITVSVTGGASPYTYNWGGGVTTQNRTGLAAGTYNLTVTDANSCTKTANVTLTQPTALSLSTSITNIVCGVGTGAINLTVTGGTSPYSYNWGGGITTEDRTSLALGSYTVTVTDGNSCTATTTASITQTTSATLSTSVTNVSCFGTNTGAINLTASGGSPYTYNWSGGVTTEDRTGLAAGTYSVTVTNTYGCTSSTSAAVTTPSVLAVSASTTQVNCTGGSNGAIDISVTGGTAPYTYNWGGGVTSQDRTGLAAGTYTVTVTDANSCTTTLSRTITQPTALNLSTVITQVTCVGGTDGAIDLTVTGGTSPYTYNWGGGITSQDRTGLPAGTYSVTVTDGNSCTATTGATLTPQNGAPSPPTGLKH